MVGLICAMEEELALVRASFAQSRINAALSGLGKVNAALATDSLIRSGADCILNIGVAGALDPSLKLGDTVICSEIAYHDVWCGEPNLPGQVQGLPQRFTPGRELFDAAVSVLSTAKTGLGISGDRFVTAEAEVKALRAMFPEALCVDMEAAAIAHCCYLHGVPFLNVKILSDSGNGDEYAAFWSTIAERSFETIKPLLEKLCV